MSDSLLKRLGAAIGLSKLAAPTTTIGSNKSSASDYGYVVERGDTELNLVGNRRYETYQAMIRDTAIVAAGVRLFVNLLANAVWTVNPPEDLDNEALEKEAQEYADQAYAMLFNMTSSWSAVIRKLAMFRFQGFAVMEWTAKREDDGSIGLLDIEHRPQSTIIRWVRDESGTVEKIVQRIPGGVEAVLPRGKVVYAVDDTFSDSPEGVGLFRHLATIRERLKLFLELEEIGFANDLRGIPIARAPLGELASDIAKATPGTPERAAAEAARKHKIQPLHDFLDNHVRNAEQGVMLPSDVFISTGSDGNQNPTNTHKWGLELLSGQSTSFEAMADAVKRMNGEMARIMGVEHLLLGQDGGGSLALARSKVGTFYLTVTSTLLDIAEVLDRDILKPLAELNGWPEELRPRMGVNEVSDRDLEQVTRALADLAQAGAPLMPNDPAVGEIYDSLGLTRPPEERVDADADASLNATRKDPVDPDKQVVQDNPEDKTAKARRGLVKRRAK